MNLSAPLTTSSAAADQRPRDHELDMFGLTHPGLVRSENQDQFLLCTVHPQVVLHGSSLPEPNKIAMRGERLASILLVADGVGGSAAGSRASRLATEAVTRYLASSLRSYHAPGVSSEGQFVQTLQAAALQAHDMVRAESLTEPAVAGMATTLCLAIVIWPWLYVVQVGDSRCYFFQDGRLQQVTRDQTFAQDLIEQGILSPEDARSSPLHHVLSSAIGASAALPEITRVDVRNRGCVVLLCTDGLTKHVSDAEIAQHLESMESSEQVCRTLLQLALDRGGSDNITIVAGRAPLRSGQSGAPQRAD
jgi:serine/threonine protein phosphatase PrpC